MPPCDTPPDRADRRYAMQYDTKENATPVLAVNGSGNHHTSYA